jgi:hypothetical protein
MIFFHALQLQQEYVEKCFAIRFLRRAIEKSF